MDTDEYLNYLAKLPFIDLIGRDVDAPETQERLRNGLRGENLTAGMKSSEKKMPTDSQMTIHYYSAKVVLVGESGAGKTGLSLVLRHLPFRPSDSTNALSVRQLESRNIQLTENKEETREIFLWDLAGQPPTRLPHQLYLSDVAIALIVFDAAQENPFPSIYYWACALRHAQRVRQRKNYSDIPLQIFLVAARTDVGRISLSAEEVANLKEELDFKDYFPTSAKEGLNIDRLRSAIENAIDWSALRYAVDTHVNSANISLSLVHSVKSFLIGRRLQEPIFSTRAALYQEFRAMNPDQKEASNVVLNTCIKWMEMQGLIRTYTFKDSVLLNDEFVGIYTVALINSIVPGDDCIAEQKIKSREFAVYASQRVQDERTEKDLVLAMGEELLSQELAFRQKMGDNWYFVFPSLSTKRITARHYTQGQRVNFHFKGSPPHIYAALVTRLKRSGQFSLKSWSRDTAIYSNARVQGAYGVILKDEGRGTGRLTLFFQEKKDEIDEDQYAIMCYEFERFVAHHLKSRALKGSVWQEDVFACTNPQCDEFGEPVRSNVVKVRQKEGWTFCQSCTGRISLRSIREALILKEENEHEQSILDMNRHADRKGDEEVRSFIRDAKPVYFCYSDTDEQEVRNISKMLKKRGNECSFTIEPWLERDQVPPGRSKWSERDKQIRTMQSAIVFLGRDGQSLLQKFMEEALLDEFTQRRCPVIPALLPGLPEDFRVPSFLANLTWVDFRKSDPDPLDALIWGITGERCIKSTIFYSEEEE